MNTAIVCAKQKIKLLVEEAFSKHFKIDSAVEVERYNYGTKLGTLKHIDYAIPLFGYAKEAKQNPHEFYKKLVAAIGDDLPCETEFVNGYMNIMLDDKFLKQLLESHQSEKTTKLPLVGLSVTILRSSADHATRIAAELVNECLLHSGANSDVIYPFPDERTGAAQYVIEVDDDLLANLTKLPGIVQDSDSKALHLEIGDETHALRSAKGGWYAPAFVLASIKQHADKESTVFILGLSDVNQLTRAIFPQVKALDVDIHAKHIDETFERPLRKLINNSKGKLNFNLDHELNTEQRRELLYYLDFDYDVAEALQLGDLKRVLGEATTLIKQHPLPDVARN